MTHSSSNPGNDAGAKKQISTPGAIIGGVLGGSAAGTILAGPVGTIAGALAGAIGGGWVALADKVDQAYTEEHDDSYRAHFESLANLPEDRGFEHYRPAYQLGHLAARNPDNATRGWNEVDTELARGWDAAMQKTHGGWEGVRPYARAAYEWERAAPHGDPLAGAVAADIPSTSSDEPERASFTDPLPVRSHPLDPSVRDVDESKEQAPPSPEWLKTGAEPGGQR